MAGFLIVAASGLAAHAQVSVSVDYAKPGQQSSGLIFGGDVADCTPDLSARGLGKGVRFIRGWFAMWKLIPDGSIEDYRANRNNLRDPSTWNWDEADKFTAFARDHNLSVMACLHGCPKWLSYSDCADHVKGWGVGVPKAWDVWEDIVTKIAARIGDRVDYYEIWNEPDFNNKYLDLRGSGMTNREAYREIYIRTWNAIREADTESDIGGPCFVGAPIKNAANLTNRDRYDWLNEFLGDPEIKDRIDFVSYHNYQAPEYPEQHEPSNAWTKVSMMSHLGRLLPIFITEWNQHFDWGYRDEPESIGFHASQFIHFINSGLHGSGFFNMSGCICCKRTFDDGRWVWTNVWKIASVKAGLGRGVIQAVSASYPQGVLAAGAINAAGVPSVLLTGHSGNAEVVMKNTGATGPTDCSVYLATVDNDGSSPWRQESLSPDANGDLSITLALPDNCAAAVVLDKEVSTAAADPASARRVSCAARPSLSRVVAGMRRSDVAPGSRYDLQGRMLEPGATPRVAAGVLIIDAAQPGR
jgi:hypothetical protein